jgi:DNA-binding GntR family transcriptional regulator
MIKLQRRRNLATQITEGLFEAILRGELKPGEQIIETKMAKQLGVGQSTFREALQALEHRGLVTKNRNTFVTQLTVQDVEVLFAVRLELEPLAASLACGKLTAEQLRQLQLHLDRMEKARLRRDFPSLLKNDLAFHQIIWEAPRTGALKRILNLVLPPLFAFFYTRHSHAFSDDPALAEETFRKEHEDHGRLFDALQAGDPEEAKRTFREVTQHFVRTILELKADAASGWSSLPPPETRQEPSELRDMPQAKPIS